MNPELHEKPVDTPEFKLAKPVNGTYIFPSWRELVRVINDPESDLSQFATHIMERIPMPLTELSTTQFVHISVEENVQYPIVEVRSRYSIWLIIGVIILPLALLAFILA